MNIHNEAMDLLKYIYDGLSEGYDSYNVSEDKLEAMSPNDRTSFLASVNYLKQESHTPNIKAFLLALKSPLKV